MSANSASRAMVFSRLGAAERTVSCITMSSESLPENRPLDSDNDGPGYQTDERGKSPAHRYREYEPLGAQKHRQAAFASRDDEQHGTRRIEQRRHHQEFRPARE